MAAAHREQQATTAILAPPTRNREPLATAELTDATRKSGAHTTATTKSTMSDSTPPPRVVLPPKPSGPMAPTRKEPVAPSVNSFSVGPASLTSAAFRPNLVRQNLRNANGSCRGKRASHKKQQPNKFQRYRKEYKSTPIERPQGLDSQTGTDPVDDFVDGVDPSKSTTAAVNAKGIPMCQGHQQPCCLRTVRKSGSAHKGRKFYVCSMDRREQCNHFQWADEGTAAHAVVTREDSTTAFVQRQVQAYLQNLQPLTLPELRLWASVRHLDTRGKRGQVWTRIALYVRDEIASALEEGANDDEDDDDDGTKKDDDKGSEEALELIGAPPVVKATKKDDDECHSDDDSDEDELEFTGGPASTASQAKKDVLVPPDENDPDADDESDEELEFTGAPLSKGFNATKETENTDSDDEELVVAKPKKDDFVLDESTDDESEDELDIEPKNSVNTRARKALKEDETVSVDEDESDEELEIIPQKVQKTKAIPNQTTDCPLRKRLQSLFGYSDFRPGQEWTIRRCLEGQRTLLVAPTGLGKSLCYALPAAMQPDGVVLVVSPLLSLIQDQLRELPPSLPAASLSGTTPSPTLLQDLRRGRLRILFVSPERLVSPSFRRLLSKTSWNEATRSYERIMPPVSLFCVDEAHCLSQVSSGRLPFCAKKMYSDQDLALLLSVGS